MRLHVACRVVCALWVVLPLSIYAPEVRRAEQRLHKLEQAKPLRRCSPQVDGPHVNAQHMQRAAHEIQRAACNIQPSTDAIARILRTGPRTSARMQMHARR